MGHGLFSPEIMQRSFVYNALGNMLRNFYTESLRISAYLPEKTLEEIQNEKLRAILLAVKRTVPFWANKFPTNKKIRETPAKEILNSVPAIQKADLRSAGVHAINSAITKRSYAFDWLPNQTGASQRFWISKDFSVEICDYYYGRFEYDEGGRISSFMALEQASYPKLTGDACFRDITSGSTGEPLAFFLDKSFALKTPGLYTRIFEMAGGREGDLFVRFSAKDRPFPTGLIHFPCPFLPQIPASVLQLAKFLNGRKAVLYATASVLLETARTVKTHKVEMDLRAVIAASEAVTEEEQIFIEGTLHCRLFRSYATRELGWLAQECENGGMHINIEWALIEILDDKGNSLPRDSLGRIIVTIFDNVAMPFIRYDTGDLGAILSQYCPCGRTLPLLKFVGRERGLLLLPDGRVIHHFNILGPFYQMRRIELIRRFQVVQEKKNLVTVHLVTSQEFPEEEITSLKKDLSIIVGPEVNFSIKIVKEVAENRGKRKLFISKISQEVSSCARDIKS